MTGGSNRSIRRGHPLGVLCPPTVRRSIPTLERMAALLNPWRGMTMRRLVRTLAFVLGIGVLIVMLGQWWIVSSEPYELGREAIGSKLKVPAESVELKRIAQFEFVDGSFSGHASFVLCAPTNRCFTVAAKKREARWALVNLVENK
jgi:hypothetical protein